MLPVGEVPYLHFDRADLVAWQVPLSIRARLGEWLPWLPGRVLDSVQEVAMPCIDLEAAGWGGGGWF